MWTRRRFLAATGLTLGGAAAPRAALADPPPEGNSVKDLITPETQHAIDQGLAFLAASQRTDGSFGNGQYVGNVAVSSLAALALMAGGHQSGRGRYGRHVTRALEYILGTEQGSSGYLLSRSGGNSHGPMYGHGFGALFLAEVHGMVSDKALKQRTRDTLKRSINLIVDSQNREGGWRYTPQSRDADISVTICQIMALRAARNAGLMVPKSTVDKCIEYVKNCQDLPGGGFRYMKQGGPVAFARTAAGVVALYCAGIYKGPEIDAGLQYLMQFRPNQQGFRPNFLHGASMHYYYGHYYAVQAMWTAGGRYWAEWFPAIRDELLHHPERGRGYWGDMRICNEYATAMACIILQIPNNYLPILQK